MTSSTNSGLRLYLLLRILLSLLICSIICAIYVIAVYIGYDIKSIPDKYAIVLVIPPFTLLIFFIVYVKKITFICPHCLKSIFIRNIKNFICPFCDHKNRSYWALLIFCFSCRSKIQFYECPHCSEAIDFFKPYNVKQLKSRRYE